MTGILSANGLISTTCDAAGRESHCRNSEMMLSAPVRIRSTVAWVPNFTLVGGPDFSVVLSHISDRQTIAMGTTNISGCEKACLHRCTAMTARPTAQQNPYQRTAQPRANRASEDRALGTISIRPYGLSHFPQGNLRLVGITSRFR